MSPRRMTSLSVLPLLVLIASPLGGGCLGTYRDDRTVPPGDGKEFGDAGAAVMVPPGAADDGFVPTIEPVEIAALPA